MLGARATLLLAAVALLAGAAFDSPALYVPAISLALLVAGSRIWVRLAARHARIDRERGPWSIVEGEPYNFLVTVRAGRIPLPGGTVVQPEARRAIPVGIRSLRRLMVEVPGLRRGRHRLAPVTLEVTDPFRLNGLTIPAGEGDQVLVLPRIEPVLARPGRGSTGVEAGEGLEGIGAAGLDTRSIDFEIDGIRPYREGTPASRIHWPTVARVGEIVEHRLVSGADSSPLVALDSSSPDDTDALDRAVRAAASLAVHLALHGGCALLLSGERRPHDIDPQLRTWAQIHARLALVEGGGPPPILSRAAASRSDTLFWVTASSAPSAAPVAIAAARSYLVAPGPGGGDATFTVAGCHGRRLGAPARRTRAA
jgi:uncharacterized protein (DUF58 family)